MGELRLPHKRVTPFSLLAIQYRQQDWPICRYFKPSDGLEPSTRCRSLQARVAGRSGAGRSAYVRRHGSTRARTYSATGSGRLRPQMDPSGRRRSRAPESRPRIVAAGESRWPPGLASVLRPWIPCRRLFLWNAHPACRRCARGEGRRSEAGQGVAHPACASVLSPDRHRPAVFTRDSVANRRR